MQLVLVVVSVSGGRIEIDGEPGNGNRDGSGIPGYDSCNGTIAKIIDVTGIEYR